MYVSVAHTYARRLLGMSGCKGSAKNAQNNSVTPGWRSMVGRVGWQRWVAVGWQLGGSWVADVTATQRVQSIFTYFPLLPGNTIPY